MTATLIEIEKRRERVKKILDKHTGEIFDNYSLRKLLGYSMTTILRDIGLFNERVVKVKRNRYIIIKTGAELDSSK